MSQLVIQQLNIDFSNASQYRPNQPTKLTQLLLLGSIVFQFLGSLHHQFCSATVLETPGNFKVHVSSNEKSFHTPWPDQWQIGQSNYALKHWPSITADIYYLHGSE